VGKGLLLLLLVLLVVVVLLLVLVGLKIWRLRCCAPT
jgi:hypothetical protein